MLSIIRTNNLKYVLKIIKFINQVVVIPIVVSIYTTI